VTTYLYDAADRLTTLVYGTTGTLTYLYDKADNRIGMWDRDGGLTSYSYDAAGRLTRIQNQLQEVTTFGYDAIDRETGRSFFNAAAASVMTMQRGFDADGRITTLSYQSAAITALSTMTYDKVGNVLTSREWDGGVTTYAYDNSDQLTKERRSGPNAYTRDYSYDGVGNRLVLKDGAVLTTSTYDAANQLQTQLEGSVRTTLTYDNAGNRTLENVGGVLTTYTWNQENRLTVLQQSNGTVTTLLYSGDGDLRQRNANGTVLKFLRDGENLVQEVLGTATFRRYTDFPGEWGGLISVNDPAVSNSSRFFTFDRMGSTRLMLTSSGSVENTMLFTGFGEQLVSTGADLKRFGYEGAFGYLRLTTNLMWVRERIYDASTGAWLSQDPIGFEGGGWNLFRYVDNNSTNIIDPLGLHHHLIPRVLWRKYVNKNSILRKVFDSKEFKIMDPLYKGHNTKSLNGFTAFQYNNAVRSELSEYLSKIGKQSIVELSENEMRNFATKISKITTGTIGRYNAGVRAEMAAEIAAAKAAAKMAQRGGFISGDILCDGLGVIAKGFTVLGKVVNAADPLLWLITLEKPANNVDLDDPVLQRRLTLARVAAEKMKKNTYTKNKYIK
jgi:RHS repeat-associated protein